MTGADELEVGAEEATGEAELLTTGAGADVMASSAGAEDELGEATGAGKTMGIDEETTGGGT